MTCSKSVVNIRRAGKKDERVEEEVSEQTRWRSQQARIDLSGASSEWPGRLASPPYRRDSWGNCPLLLPQLHSADCGYSSWLPSSSSSSASAISFRCSAVRFHGSQRSTS